MKIKIIYLLLPVTFYVLAMHNHESLESVTANLSSVTDLHFEQTNDSPLVLLPDEVKLRLFSYVVAEETLNKAKSNIGSLVRTCKDFHRLCHDAWLFGKMVKRLEKRITEPSIFTDVKTHYWRVLVIARELKNQFALNWFYAYAGKKVPVYTNNRAPQEYRQELKDILLEFCSGVSFAEYACLDPRPITILKIKEIREETLRPIVRNTLSMRACGLRNLDGIEYLENLSKVEVVDLSSNKLNTVNQFALDQFSQIKRLNLAGNNLESIDMKTFSNLKHLIKIDLSENKITEVVCDHAMDKKLEMVDLRANKISKIALTTLKNINAEVIDLQKNPIADPSSIRKLSKPVTKRILVDY